MASPYCSAAVLLNNKYRQFTADRCCPQ